MSDKPDVIDSSIVHANPHFAVRRDRLRYGNGHVDDYYVIEQPNFVILIALDADRVAVVEQYRHSVGERLIELPMGRVDKGENPHDTARRELLEEVGCEASTVALLRTVKMATGSSRSTAHVFLAAGLRPTATQPALDPTEHGLASRFLPLDEWRQMVRDGRVCDGNTLAGWMAYEAR